MQVKILEAHKLIINRSVGWRTDTTPIQRTQMGTGFRSRTSLNSFPAGRCPWKRRRKKAPVRWWLTHILTQDRKFLCGISGLDSMKGG